MIKVKVPASSANMGPGFDCMGVALNLYNEVCIEKINSPRVEVEILDDSKSFMPTDERNYVYSAMGAVFRKANKEFSGYRITINNAIPILKFVYLFNIFAKMSVPPVDAFIENVIARPDAIIIVPYKIANVKLVVSA